MLEGEYHLPNLMTTLEYEALQKGEVAYKLTDGEIKIVDRWGDK